jgi:hypothetical protein
VRVGIPDSNCEPTNRTSRNVTNEEKERHDVVRGELPLGENQHVLWERRRNRQIACNDMYERLGQSLDPHVADLRPYSNGQLPSQDPTKMVASHERILNRTGDDEPLARLRGYGSVDDSVKRCLNRVQPATGRR